MTLNEWLKRWQLPDQAVSELHSVFNIDTDPSTGAEQSEAAVQTAVRLEASQVGARLFRNNVGAYQDPDSGRWVRYGLANDSKQMNQQIKSADLIGIRPILITEQHIGFIIGQFIAREVKAGGWTYKATEREVAQLRFLQLIASLGGDAQFANSVGTLQ